MKPSITRRRAIAGTGTAFLGGAGIVSLPARYYPAPVIDWLVGQRSKPNLDWRPPISQALFTESYDVLRDRLDRATTLWSQVDTDDELSPAAQGGKLAFQGIESTVESLGTVTPSWEMWSELSRAHLEVGEAIGGALVALDDADPQTVVDRGETLRSQIASLREQTEYRIDDAGVDLGWLYWIERSLALGKLRTHRNGLYIGETTPASEYEDHDIVRTMSNQAGAREQLRLARQWHRAYTDRLDEPSDVTDKLEELRTEYADEVNRLRVSREQLQQSLDDMERGVYRHARARLASLTVQDLDSTDGYTSDGLLVRQTIREARNVLKLRAYQSALDAFALSPGESVDPLLLYRAERRATNRLKAVHDRVSAPLATGMLRDAAGRVRNAHIGLDNDGRQKSARAEAYAAYLSGEHQLRHAPAVLEPFGDGRIELDGFEG